MGSTKKAKYRITAEDLPYAVSYLIDACKKSALKEQGDYLEKGAETDDNWLKYLETFVGSKDQAYDAESLQRRCEKVLTAEQWQKMRLSIRQRKFRARSTMLTGEEKEQTKHIDITDKAYDVLKNMMKAGEAKNPSDAILVLFNKAQETNSEK